VAITRDGALLLDPTTGDVRANLLAGRTGTVTAGDRIVSADGADLQAVSVADGSVLWRAPVRTVAPTVAGDTVYGVTDEDVPQLVATDAGSGDRLWEFPRDEAAFPADASVAARDDFVYLADGTALYGILPEGAMAGEDTPLITATEAASEPLCLWRHEVEEDMWTSSLRAVDVGVVIANRSGTVCLRRHTDGEPVWCVRVPGVARAEPTIYPAEGRLFVVTEVGITAIDTGSGERIWSREGRWPWTVMAGDRLIAVDREGRVAALSLATGTLTRPIDTSVGVPSAIAADGDTLYVGHGDGTVISVDMARGITG
jgi:outer membrane protein assembly factor BamB